MLVELRQVVQGCWEDEKRQAPRAQAQEYEKTGSLPEDQAVLQFRGDRCCPRDSPYGRLVVKGEQGGPSGALARPPPGPRLLEQARPGSQRRAISR
ncbi:hypothetical protein NDU88_007933 [Pleurodeles waltl]|uniref:Uncharacterized protein n=1 Tax=Pleurodeles waltl TaxID=8319 RepID=A0AAV7QT92_PLEWA|nr:hypothetical protein NDU88_007933 [Pleurodeles waltl]